jgi:hypothetical protein
MSKGGSRRDLSTLAARLRAQAEAEDGIAIVIAVQILAIMSLMVAAVLASSVHLHGSTGRDVASKDALAGALSGLDVARYRLNELAPANNMCVTTQAVATGTSGAAAGECPAYVGDLGNGTTYGYYVTPALATGARCGGQTVTASADGSTSRCVTGFGTANGVTRRTQTLVKNTSGAAPLFPVAGIVGLSGVRIKGNPQFDSEVRGAVATNGTFELDKCSHPVSGVTSFAPGPLASLSESCSGTVTAAPPKSTPWTLAPIDTIYAGTQAVNDNAIFGSASGFTYNAATRDLKDTTNAALIINGPNPRIGSGGVWTFNFCSVFFTHLTQIKLLNGATARILVDDPSRPGSGCTKAGLLKMTGVAAMNYETTTSTPGDAKQLQFYSYGSNVVELHNQAGFSATLYAPQAEIKMTNKTRWWGAIASNGLEALSGLDFTATDASEISDGNPQAGPYARAGFVECRSATPTATDPESGC